MPFTELTIESNVMLQHNIIPNNYAERTRKESESKEEENIVNTEWNNVQRTRSLPAPLYITLQNRAAIMRHKY